MFTYVRLCVCVCVDMGWRVSTNWTASQAADTGRAHIPPWTCCVSPAAAAGSTSALPLPHNTSFILIKKNRRKREGTRIHSQRQESASLGHTLLITTQTPYRWTMTRPLVFANLFNITRQLTYTRTTLIEPVSQTTSRPRTISGTPAE